MSAAHSGHAEIVTALIEGGADVNLVDEVSRGE